MDNSSYISLTLASSLERSLDISANNLANVNTAGFKGERTLFESYLLQPTDIGKDDVFFSIDSGSYMDPTQGALIATGNPLDAAVLGEGWFAYQAEGGQTALGRNGQFVVDADGALRTAGGAQVLDAGGGPIAIPVEATAVSIGADGTISDQNGEAVAQLGVFAAPDIQSYARLTGGMFAPADGTAPPLLAVEAPRLLQGHLEQSNVEPVVEMTRMMGIQRAYERAMTLLEDENSLRRDTLQRLGPTS
ncbi:flagellar hook basal-body protein [Frigidibacter sp. MR17.24]|uniref:flagellar hook basal-body protein n=1 Tax=Frigidibacter sp. MR17.24 TaxID=3127345 RepID=UPI0030131D9A